MANAKVKKSKTRSGKGTPSSASSAATSANDIAKDLERLSLESGRVTSGILTSQRDSRDIKIEQFSLSYHSQVLVTDGVIELNFGRRYGLIGANGCGMCLPFCAPSLPNSH